ncbi:sigma 54-interacting transcriptional regulator [Reinekea blandensis]|uniref:Putative transcriptional regulator of two-component regulator protein (EBP familiiy) n=1 Tax=Reinekea blandensis MED297 TaxID=314283 RepID=A4BIZ7_9GAMM|nr:sigma 54-interacting transcriptional regulator [Reinekea blandensis]EAR07930.1 putative transcriptional regulator of two-component regulator protein (EBP familiiy) [Reinekea sp. MED297] [Reinekea blandensis MED297]
MSAIDTASPVPKPQDPVLVIDDDSQLLKLVEIRLNSEGYAVVTADSAAQAKKKLASQRVSMVLSDLRMPGEDGLMLLDFINAEFPTIPVIIMTAHGTIHDAVEATENGALGFLTKPIDHQQLRSTLTNACAQISNATGGDWQSDIVYQSQKMHQLMEQVGQVAPRDISLMITGASGTGKELMAQAIHKASCRANKPFIAVNCGALPEHLLESELFGHKKGAFTGAVSDHQGLFQAADGGTLFLDEIGDMPLALQVKLLRVLQEKSIRPVGSTKTIDVDVRVVSATHRNLKEAMSEGQFREDLFYRLCVVNVQIPSLSERPEDIPVLTRVLLHRIAQKQGVKITRFADDAMLKLCQSNWPGNVRQLINVIEQCVAMSQSPVISRALVNQALLDSHNYFPTLAEARDAYERSYLIRVLTMTDGVASRAAELAGRNRTEFYKLLKKHELDVNSFKPQH